MSLVATMDLNRFPPANVLHTQLQLHHQMLYRQHNATHHHHHHRQHPDEIPPNGWLLPPTPGAGPTLPGDVTVSLQNGKLWQQFHAETTEMIITKLGRRMFPSLQLKVDGLERRSRYCLLLEVAPASRRRHKYVGGGVESGVGASNSRGWTSAGPAEPQPHVNRRVYLHPDSPATGTHWMQHPVSFNKLKLTNNAVDHHSNVVLTSMHKYVPRIWIVRCDDVARLNSLFTQPASSFCFPETEFIAVTAYQNENITKLKIDNNPFAKGFRETGQSRCKRKIHHMESSGYDHSEDSHLEERSYEDEESSSTISSSELESSRFLRLQEDTLSSRRVKRATSETRSLDDSGVSSSGSASPPLLPKKDNSNQQPRLHRPWADDNDVPTNESPKPLTTRTDAIDTVSNLHRRSNSQPLLHSQSHLLPSHHISAIEFARIQQIQHYQQMQYEQYCHINQLHRLKNLALHIPFANLTTGNLTPLTSEIYADRTSYHNNAYPGNEASPSPARSPTDSTDGVSSLR